MSKNTINAIKPGLIVLVTAGASGIGREIAKTFFEHGCRVHICDVDQSAIDDFLAEYPECSASLADVSNFSMVEALFAEVQALYGHLDILINNAGTAGPTSVLEDIEPADWDSTVAVNLNGQFYCSKLAIPLIRLAGGGSIINMASSAALFGYPNRAPYAASKWAVIGLTKTMAMELGESNIRVNAICPGSVEGPRIDSVIRKDAEARGKTIEEIRDLYTRQTSLRRFIDPQEIAHMAVFLASTLGRSISGQVLSVDGHTESLSSVFN